MHLTFTSGYFFKLVLYFDNIFELVEKMYFNGQLIFFWLIFCICLCTFYSIVLMIP